MKTIVILSPDTWGKMMLSKMHFAKELAREGDRVFFINPPRKEIIADKRIQQVEKNLAVVSLKEHPLRVFSREKCRPLYRFIERKYIREIKEITGHIDELWCFNAFFISDLKLFQSDKTLLFVYDLYVRDNLRKAATQADGIVSISQEILNEFNDSGKPRLLLHHGLAPAFERMTELDFPVPEERESVKIGYVGNLMRQGIDLLVFKNIIAKHSSIEFHFWGPVQISENNLITDTPSEEITGFIQYLKSCPNVILHGVKSAEELAEDMKEMDAFLYLYNASLDVNAGYNSHKLMEYLATGKAIFSPYVSRFEGADLIIMDTKENVDFESFFNRNIPQINEYNQPELRQKRISFALENTYQKQVERIRGWIDEIN